MPAKLVTVESPKHPLYALTTSELAGYRRQLEGALAGLGIHDPASPARSGLHARLDAVLAEQDSRAKIARAR